MTKNKILKDLGFLPDKRQNRFYSPELEFELFIPQRKVTYEEIATMIYNIGFANGKDAGAAETRMNIKVALGIRL